MKQMGEAQRIRLEGARRESGGPESSRRESAHPESARRVSTRAESARHDSARGVLARAARTDARIVRELRGRTRLSQSDFAALLGVELSTLRNWEQGRRAPTGPARALLRAISNDPQNVIRALARAA